MNLTLTFCLDDLSPDQRDALDVLLARPATVPAEDLPRPASEPREEAAPAVPAVKRGRGRPPKVRAVPAGDPTPPAPIVSPPADYVPDVPAQAPAGPPPAEEVALDEAAMAARAAYIKEAVQKAGIRLGAALPSTFDTIRAVIARFRQADGTPCSKLVQVQVKDTAELIAQLEALRPTGA